MGTASGARVNSAISSSGRPSPRSVAHPSGGTRPATATPATATPPAAAAGAAEGPIEGDAVVVVLAVE